MGVTVTSLFLFAVEHETCIVEAADFCCHSNIWIAFGY